MTQQNGTLDHSTTPHKNAQSRYLLYWKWHRTKPEPLPMWLDRAPLVQLWFFQMLPAAPGSSTRTVSGNGHKEGYEADDGDDTSWGG